jgi:hypothetical protein
MSSICASSPSVTVEDEQSKRSFGGRLIRWMTARTQRKANRQILDVLATLPASYRDNFVMELERRLLGQ